MSGHKKWRDIEHKNSASARLKSFVKLSQVAYPATLAADILIAVEVAEAARAYITELDSAGIADTTRLEEALSKFADTQV